MLKAVRQDAELSELPIIICTGDLLGLEERAEEIAKDPRVRTLRKPFQVADLEAMVRSFVGEDTSSR